MLKTSKSCGELNELKGEREKPFLGLGGHRRSRPSMKCLVKPRVKDKDNTRVDRILLKW